MVDNMKRVTQEYSIKIKVKKTKVMCNAYLVSLTAE